MDEIEVKILMAKHLREIAQTIRANDPESLDHEAYHLDSEAEDLRLERLIVEEEEVARRRTIAERRNPRTVKELQEKTGIGLYTCKNLLEDCDWDINKALLKARA